MEKSLKIPSDDIQTIVTGMGGCVASDRITVDGVSVGFMYRDEPLADGDSGWRFLAGDESDEYMDDMDRHSVYEVNTIANYDADILPHLEAPIGAEFERIDDGTLVPVDNES